MQVGNRLFKNYESASYGYIDFAKALQISCDTFFYRVGLRLLAAVRHATRPTWTPRTRWSRTAKEFGFGSPTGIDIPGEASGRIADRHWKLAYWKPIRATTARSTQGDRTSDFLHVFAHEFCVEG